MGDHQGPARRKAAETPGVEQILVLAGPGRGRRGPQGLVRVGADPGAAAGPLPAAIRTLMEQAGVARFEPPGYPVVVDEPPADGVGKTDRKAPRADPAPRRGAVERISGDASGVAAA